MNNHAVHILIGHSNTVFISWIVLDFLLSQLNLFSELVPAIIFCSLFHAWKIRLKKYKNSVFDKDTTEIFVLKM